MTGNRGDGPTFNTAKAPGTTNGGSFMQREVSPVESRSGVVSGRVFLVLISSFIGAVIALGLAWALFIRPH
jgi:hypothetical protein